jgi:ABC-type branched-subunit amino acid transport system substrate-binding protein
MKTHLLFFLVALPLFFSLGCGKQPVSQPPSTPEAVQPSPRIAKDLAGKAEQAWEARDYFESQRRYTELLEDPNLPQGTAPLAWERLTTSAVKNRDWNRAQSALNKWARAFPEAMTSWAWNMNKAALIEEEQDSSAAERFLKGLVEDSDLPEGTRTQAAKEFIRRAAERNDLAGTLNGYGLQYDHVSSHPDRLALETEVTRLLRDKPLDLLAEAANATRQEPITSFPKNILTGMYDLKRLEENADLWPQVWQDLITLKDKSPWAGDFPFDQDLETLTQRLGQPRQHIALALPLQGSYASIGWRIAQGVGAGQWYLNSRGMDLQVTIINSASPEWTKELADLAPTCRIVGGPLRKSAWQAIRENELEEERVFFTFMPTLEEEGTRAWRFFGSPRDQVRALVRSARNQTISRFAILYPQEPYGRVMAQYFWEEATSHGGEITGMNSYTPGEPTAWGKTVSRLLEAEGLDKGELNPEPDFQAVFLPDSLENAKLIVPQFFFYNENRMLFLGSQLWEQGPNPDSPMEASYFDLAVYPGGWWKDNPGPAMTELNRILQETGQRAPDFWTALGFDFIRFSTGLTSPGTPPDHQTVNRDLTTRKSFSWTMAPLSWDENGIASQNYFVFHPTQAGPEIVDPEHISSRRSQREARRKQLASPQDRPER